MCFVSTFFVLCFSALSVRAADYTVTNLNGGGAGSLPQAVADANGTIDDDTISFAANLGCVNNVCNIILPNELIIASPSSGRLRIDNQTAQTITLSPTTYRAFYVNGTLEINRLTISGGRGRTIYDPASDRNGGAVFVNNGSFTMTESAIRDSRTPVDTINESGGAIYVKAGTVIVRDSELTGNSSGNGGAIKIAGDSVTLDRVLIYDNRAKARNPGSGNGGAGSGGGIDITGGALSMVNTTIFKNYAESVDIYYGVGGAIDISNATMQLTNSTIVYNSAGRRGGIGVGNSVTIRLRNNIVLGNTADQENYDYTGSNSYTSGGNNIFGSTSYIRPGDTQGVSEAQAGISQTLGSNGGATRTLSLAANSVLINAGNNCVRSVCSGYGEPFPISVDQRGVSRFDNGNVDIGAFERYFVQFTTNSQLPNGRQNEFYDANLFVSGGVAPYNFALTDGSLPPGLQLTTEGRIYGTPTAWGTYNFTAQVTDSSPASGFTAEKMPSFGFLAPEAVSNTRSFQLQILAPTAASVSVGGRVLNVSGRGIYGATVTLTDATGNTRQARTNSFGYYRFYDVAAGQTIVVQARHKRFEFAPRGLSVAAEMNNLNFTATE